MMREILTECRQQICRCQKWKRWQELPCLCLEKSLLDNPALKTCLSSALPVISSFRARCYKRLPSMDAVFFLALLWGCPFIAAALLVSGLLVRKLTGPAWTHKAWFLFLHPSSKPLKTLARPRRTQLFYRYLILDAHWLWGLSSRADWLWTLSPSLRIWSSRSGWLRIRFRNVDLLVVQWCSAEESRPVAVEGPSFTCGHTRLYFWCRLRDIANTSSRSWRTMIIRILLVSDFIVGAKQTVRLKSLQNIWRKNCPYLAVWTAYFSQC